jgi:hypothetical protein
MSQQEIFEYMKRHRRWFSTREIAEILGISCGNACRGLGQLAKYGEIMTKKIKIGSSWTPVWRIK